ncbi:MAG: hypothetical protein QM500_11275 [Methylococcales bacterium]
MQLINYWPSEINISLPEEVKQALLTHLLEPFDDEENAKVFWQDYPSIIVIFDQNDPIDSLQWFNDELQHQIEFTQTNPEYSDTLVLGYSVKLSITSDAGNGLYLVAEEDTNG